MMTKNRDYSLMLIFIIVRVLLGGFISVLVGMTIFGDFSFIRVCFTCIFAGVLCIPCAILFFMKQYYFNICFFMQVVVNTIAIVLILVLLPYRYFCELYFLGLVLLMDWLFVLYLGLSKVVKNVFGGGLFAKKEDLNNEGSIDMEKMPQGEESQNMESGSQNVQETGDRSQGFEQTATDIDERQVDHFVDTQNVQQQPYVGQGTQYASQQQPYVGQNQQYAQQQNMGATSQSQNYSKETPKRDSTNKGAKLGLLIGFLVLVAYIIIIVSITVGFTFSTVGNISRYIGGHGVINDRINDEIENSISESFVPEVYENTAILDYAESEITEDVLVEIAERLNNTDGSFVVDFVRVYVEGDGLKIDVYTDILYDDYTDDSVYYEEEVLKNRSVSDAREEIYEMISADIEEKTGMNNPPISFAYYTTQGEVEFIVVE